MARPCCTLAALALLLACGDSPHQPTPEALIGEFSGTAINGFETYSLFLAVDQVGDSVRGDGAGALRLGRARPDPVALW